MDIITLKTDKLTLKLTEEQIKSADWSDDVENNRSFEIEWDGDKRLVMCEEAWNDEGTYASLEATIAGHRITLCHSFDRDEETTYIDWDEVTDSTISTEYGEEDCFEYDIARIAGIEFPDEPDYEDRQREAIREYLESLPEGVVYKFDNERGFENEWTLYIVSEDEADDEEYEDCEDLDEDEDDIEDYLFDALVGNGLDANCRTVIDRTHRA